MATKILWATVTAARLYPRYRGEIEHRGQIYPGKHQAIVPRELWERVQAQLLANNHAHQNQSRAAMPSLLVGLVHDEHGNRFTPAHAVKNGKRYRYYVSQAAIKNPGKSNRGPVRIPAGEIESLVCSRLCSFLGSRLEVIDGLALGGTSAATTESILAVAQQWSKRLASAATAETKPFIRTLISRVVIHTTHLDVFINKGALRSALLDNGHSLTRPKSSGLVAS